MTPVPEPFAAWLRGNNPFLSNRVSRPGAPADVPGIHDAEFRRLTDLASQAHGQRCGLGAVLWGDPGTGKSHLLGRLARWAEEGGGRAYCFSLYNLQARPDRLPRYLLRCVVSALVRGRDRAFHGTPLYDLARAVVRAALPDAEARRHRPFIEAAHRALLDRLAAPDPARVDRDAFAVLLRFYLAANAAHYHRQDDGQAGLAVRWLAGEGLDADEARRLDLRPREAAAPADNEQVKLILLALTQAAHFQGRPVLLCLDQPAENADPEQVSVLTRFLHDLIDSAANLLVITSSVEQTLRRYRQRGDITEAAWHRIAQFVVRLPFITHAQARAVLEARLGPALEPFANLPAVQEQRLRDPLFPLGGAWLDGKLRDAVELRPRQVINWAREGWEAQQEAAAAHPQAWLTSWGATGGKREPRRSLAALIEERVERALASHQARRQPEDLPPSADNLTGLVLALLKHDLPHAADVPLVDVEQPPPARAGWRPTYGLVLQRRSPGGREARVGVLFLDTDHAGSATASLKRLAEDPEPPERVVLVTDERRPLPLGASQDAKGREYLARLRARGDGFRHVNLTFAAYAELDALLAVLNQAAGNDLEVAVDGAARLVGEREVAASEAWRRSCRAHPLLSLLLGAEGGEEPPATDGVPVPSAEGVRELLRSHETALQQSIMAHRSLHPDASPTDLVARCQRDLRELHHVTADWPTCEAAVRETLTRMQEAGLVSG